MQTLIAALQNFIKKEKELWYLIMKKRNLSILLVLIMLCPILMTSCSNPFFGKLNYKLSTDGETYIAYGNQHMLPFLSGSKLTIPEEKDGKPVTEIANSAFGSYSTVKTIELPDSITRIGEEVFPESLVSINMPKSLISIEACAFRNTSLSFIRLPDGLQVIGKEAFAGCKNLTDLSIPNSVIYIGTDAFSPEKYNSHISDGDSRLNPNFTYNSYEGCKYFGSSVNPYMILMELEDTTATQIQVHENTKFIYNHAFYRSNIQKIQLPNGLLGIGESAFEKCFQLTDIYIPNSVIYIEDNAFQDANQIDDLYLPDNLQYLGGGVIQSYKLATTEDNGATYAMSRSNPHMYLVDFNNDSSGIIHPDTKFISSFGKFSEIILPEGLLGITHTFFTFDTTTGQNPSYNQTLKKLVIPNTVTHISAPVFRGYTALEEVVLSSGMVELGDCLFENCISLTSVTIPEGIRKIKYNAFLDCTSLPEITLPASIESPHISAFSGCDELTLVYFCGEKKYWNNSVLYWKKGYDIDPPKVEFVD